MKKFLELSYESLMGLDGTRYTEFLNVTCPGKNFESVSKDGDIIELDKVYYIVILDMHIFIFLAKFFANLSMCHIFYIV